MFLQLVHQPKLSLHEITLMTSIELLSVLAPGCNPQGAVQNKGIQAQHPKLGISSPLLKL